MLPSSTVENYLKAIYQAEIAHGDDGALVPMGQLASALHVVPGTATTMANALEAQRLVELRDRWLNPPEWVEWVDEPAPGYPKRPIPRDEDAAKALKKRTLTNLYNLGRQWLADAHEALNAAVAAAYGWSVDISDDDALRELLALNGGDV